MKITIFVYRKLWRKNIVMYYLMKEKLEQCNLDDIAKVKSPYVAVVSKNEFENNSDIFDMGIDLDTDFIPYGVTKAEVNYDSITGSFDIPNKEDFDAEPHKFAFALDERGIVFINDDGKAQEIIDQIKNSKKWKFPCLERFIYDFLEGIVKGDLLVLEGLEKEMDAMEDSIEAGDTDNIISRLNEIRGGLQDMRIHYEQLVDLAQEFNENENQFFGSKNLRFFRLFIERVTRLQGIVTSLREHTMQVRDLYQAHIDEQQNRNMTFLTIVASIFTPLTLITGWFGMNFVHMPELAKPWAYPVLIVICVVIILSEIIFFKIKKWF